MGCAVVSCAATREGDAMVASIAMSATSKVPSPNRGPTGGVALGSMSLITVDPVESLDAVHRIQAVSAGVLGSGVRKVMSKLTGRADPRPLPGRRDAPAALFGSGCALEVHATPERASAGSALGASGLRTPNGCSRCASSRTTGP
jgi:hypothetical protein